MKYILSILIFAFTLQFAGRSANRSIVDNQLITQIKFADNDSVFKSLFLYNEAGKKVVETTFYQLPDSTWARRFLTEWLYDGTKCTTQRERNWRDGKWSFSYLIDYVYENGTLQSEIHNNYINGVPQQIKKTVYEYALSNLISKKEFKKITDDWHLLTETDFRYSTGSQKDSVIIKAYKSDTLNYTTVIKQWYNQSGLLVSQTQKIITDSLLINTDSILWYYYPNTTRIQTQKNKIWNAFEKTWENSERIDYEYNDSSKISAETCQHWKSQFWENDIKYQYYYDEHQNLIKKTLLKPVYQDWRSILSVNYSNFSNNKANSIQSKYEFWGGPTGTLTTSFIPYMFNDEIAIKRANSIEIGYEQFSDTLLINKKTNFNQPVYAYPNPSNGIYYLQTHPSEVLSWIITDLNGRVLKKQDALVQSAVIDLSDYRPGIYILKVISAESQYMQKLIKQ